MAAIHDRRGPAKATIAAGPAIAAVVGSAADAGLPVMAAIVAEGRPLL